MFREQVTAACWTCAQLHAERFSVRERLWDWQKKHTKLYPSVKKTKKGPAVPRELSNSPLFLSAITSGKIGNCERQPRRDSHEAGWLQVVCNLRDSQEAAKKQPRGWVITSEACIDSTKENGEPGILLRDARVTTSTKVESSHDLMWSLCDLVALLH